MASLDNEIGVLTQGLAKCSGKSKIRIMSSDELIASSSLVTWCSTTIHLRCSSSRCIIIICTKTVLTQIMTTVFSSEIVVQWLMHSPLMNNKISSNSFTTMRPKINSKCLTKMGVNMLPEGVWANERRRTGLKSQRKSPIWAVSQCKISKFGETKKASSSKFVRRTKARLCKIKIIVSNNHSHICKCKLNKTCSLRFKMAQITLLLKRHKRRVTYLLAPNIDNKSRLAAPM